VVPCSAAVLFAGAVWALYVFAHVVYIERVHFAAAGVMFGAVSAFAVFDGLRTARLQHAKKRGTAYVVRGAALLVGCAAILKIGKAADWDYTTFTAEVWGIGLFLAFWVAQTIDLWDHASRRTAILNATAE
jgi:hypothetical protein